MQKQCKENGLTFLSTPHSSFWSVDYLDKLGLPAYKVGSGDLTNTPILKYMAKKGKPIIISTGMGTLEETIEAIKAIKEEGNDKILVLHCTTNYPCPLNEVNLRAMQTIRDKCGVLVGYSDHTSGIEIPIMATAMGARVVEKHFTLDRNIKGNSPDHTSSLTPSEIKQVIEAIRFTEQSGITDPIEAVRASHRIRIKNNGWCKKESCRNNRH
jgi:sialic acid synthase SpsE